MASKDLQMNNQNKNFDSAEKDDNHRVADEGVSSNRISKKTDKNGLFPQAKEIHDQDIPEYVEILEGHRKMCEKSGNYVEAEMAKNRINELKQQYESNRRNDLKGKHTNEKLAIEEAHLQEFNQFNEFWDKKMIEFNEQAQIIEEQMITRHQQEMSKFLEDLDNSLPPKPKDSTELLNLKRIQENLARQKDYIEAHKIQQKCNQLEKDEFDRWQTLRDAKIKNQKLQLETKQINELNALRKRIATGQDEQRKARSIELERLLQKYQNVKKELGGQHQIEHLRSGKTSKSTAGSLFKSQQASKYLNTHGNNYDSNKLTPRMMDGSKKNVVYESTANNNMRKSTQALNSKK